MHSFIDTHAHLYDEQYGEELPEIMQRCADRGVTKIYLPNLNMATIAPMIAMAKRYPDRCRTMLGLHPCEVTESFEATLTAMDAWFSQHHFVAIGEVGLDFYRSKAHAQQQVAALHIAIDWALHYDLPLVLHARNSLPELIELIKARHVKRLHGVFHCFSGDAAAAAQIIDLGFLLGIGGILTFKGSSLPSIVQQIDLRHLVLETDSPYLAPTPHRGKRNDPGYLPLIAAQIAAIKQTTLAAVARTTSDNAKALFIL